jgi:hypothetical protein
MLGEYLLDPFAGEHVGKGEPGAPQESVHHLLKSASAAAGRIWYPTHKNTLLGFVSDQTAKEGVKKLAKDGPKSKSNPRLAEIYKKSSSSVN